MEPERQTTHTHVERQRSGSGMAFIVGGLVVAVLVLAYFMFGGSDPWIGGTGGETNVTVESSTGATAGAEAPAGDAPAEGEAAATGSATTGSESGSAEATGAATSEPAQN